MTEASAARRVSVARRQRFYEEMAQAEQRLHDDPANLGTYLRERDQWLLAGGTGP